MSDKFNGTPAPAAVAVPFRQLLTGQFFRFAPDGPTFKRDKTFFVTMPTDGHTGRAMPADLDALVYPVAALAAAPAQAVAVPEGYALVPVASTAAMEWAFRRADVTYRDGAGQRQPMDPHSEFKARYRNMLTAAPAQEHATQLAGGAVAYLDLGAGGYLDIGTDLSDEQLSKLPKGRHMLVIGGTYGVDGYAAAPGEMQKESDAAQLLKKYRKLCLEIGRGDSYHIARIDAAIAAARAQAHKDEQA